MNIDEFKTKAGLVRAEVSVENGKIQTIKFSGDFFLQPAELLQELEEDLENTPIQEDALLETIQTFYRSNDIETPYLEPQDWVQTIKNALED